MELSNGTKVILQGISKRGKEKVKNHGEEWLFVKQGTVAFAKGEHMLLESLQDESRRWVKIKDDSDFSAAAA